jgi:uridine kinase
MTTVLEMIADRIASPAPTHPVRVAIDGPDASGKTILANALSKAFARRSREVIRASIDGFHLPRRQRYRRGKDSPEGYYLDSFDHQAIRAELLRPLGPGGSLRYRRATFDFRENVPSLTATQIAKSDSILVFDGVFLLRPELIDLWDFRIFLFVDYAEVLRRVAVRDRELFGSSEAALDRYRTRYIPGQMIYFMTVRPWTLADIVLDNSIPASPVILSAVSRPQGASARPSATPIFRAPEPR